MKYGILCLICLAVVGCTNAKKQIAENNTSSKTLLWGSCNLVRTDTLKGDSLGTEIFMKTLHDSYPLTVQSVTALVANPTDIFLEFGRSWNLQKWNCYGWLNAETKADFWWTDELIVLLNGQHKCHYFEFPIGSLYKLAKGKYRITKLFWHNNQELNLTAEFRIQ